MAALLFIVKDNIRIAFFPDSFLEVNGAAMTCKRLAGYAKEMDYPFLCIFGGPKNERHEDGSVTYLQLKRSPIAIRLDEDLAYDPLFQRYMKQVLREIAAFKPDVMHITGMNDVGILGAYIAWKLDIPLVGSWHTNVHEFASSRLTKYIGFLPRSVSKKIAKLAEKAIMGGAIFYYKMPKVLLAPNEELVRRLAKGTGRETLPMLRGVDTELFSPKKRTVADDIFRIGFVGRLRSEKNVRMLVEIEKQLLEHGRKNFQFLVVGEGAEREYLEKKLKNATFTGFLDGEALSEAYANMDVFVFPSTTDAFGNVAQEAMASGVPPIVTDIGGPKFLVEHGITGWIAKDAADFANHVEQMLEHPEIANGMKEAALKFASTRSWNNVFASVFDAYHRAYEIWQEQRKTSDDKI